ncbi:MAG: hypothetical protein AAF236_13915 [Verrucomicrobiota bacterium]
MKTLILSTLFLVSSISLQAGGTGFPWFKSARSTACGPRVDATIPFYHGEDRRRYNAAACPNETADIPLHLVTTQVLKKKRISEAYHDDRGKLRRTRVVYVTYRSVYSDGSTRVWTEKQS